MKAAFLFILLIAGGVRPACAAPRYVTSTADGITTGTLRSVIAAASANDTILFDPTVFAAENVTIRLAAQITINKRLTIVGLKNSAGMNKITLTGDRDLSGGYTPGDTSVFDVTEQGIRLESLDFTDSGSDLPFRGGAITISGTPAGGAPISVITGCRFENNSSRAAGGAIHSSGGFGLQIEDCVFAGNTAADYGGAISQNGGMLGLLSCTLTGNQSGQAGGAVRAEEVYVYVRESTFSGNSSGTGGAVHISNAPPPADDPVSISNSTFSGNSSTGGASGCHIAGTGDYACDLIHCTITGNTSNSGGGTNAAGAVQAGVGSTIAVRACIIAGNTDARATGTKAPDLALVTGGGVISGGGNIIGDDAGAGTAFAGADDLAGTSADPMDPGLLPLADNGGPTRTHEPHPLSPAVDFMKTATLAADQRDLPRPSGVGRDAGALERQVETYANWAAAALSAHPETERDHADDPDHDGLPNAIEYLQGTPPSIPSVAAEKIIIQDGEIYYVFRISAIASPAALSARIGASTDLVGWSYTPLPGNMAAAFQTTDGLSHQYRLPVDTTDKPEYFLRLVAGE